MNAELKSSPQITVQLAANDTDPIEPVLELERYGKLKRVLRVTGWIKRFIANAQTKTKTRGELTADELFEAEKYWNTNPEFQPGNKTTESGKEPKQ